VQIERTALVLHSAMDMYRLVHDVPSYPHFLSWCQSANVIEQTTEKQIASLTVIVAGLTQTFTTRNTLTPGQQLSLALVDGPFSRLAGDWQFQQLGTEGCKITLSLDFNFSSVILSSAFRRGFARVADHMVTDFSQRADQVYG
jgi:ribosome-associated toxin RatA of RatAB toxin-antitoxin module